jgi:hypothetical protein
MEGIILSGDSIADKGGCPSAPAKLSWAMLRDGTHYDARRAFRAYLPTQISA